MLHGAKRGELVKLPAGDPHATGDPPGEQLELLDAGGVQLEMFPQPTPADHLQAARAALTAAVAAYQDRERVVAAQRPSRRSAARVAPSQRIGA